MNRKWSKETIGLEIVRTYMSGESLSYSSTAVCNSPLLRAATRYFGTWEAAVTFAGFDYGAIRRYKTWTRERIIYRAEGALQARILPRDLSKLQ